MQLISKFRINFITIDIASADGFLKSEEKVEEVQIDLLALHSSEVHSLFNQKNGNVFGICTVCEPAGPGFDGSKNADPKMAAINSQCIHTASGGYGTRERACHQNWLMGNCGESQVGQR